VATGKRVLRISGKRASDTDEHADCSWVVDKAGDAIDEWDGSPWEVGRSAFRAQRNGNGLAMGDTGELPFSPWRLWAVLQLLLTSDMVDCKQQDHRRAPE